MTVTHPDGTVETLTVAEHLRRRRPQVYRSAAAVDSAKEVCKSCGEFDRDWICRHAGCRQCTAPGALVERILIADSACPAGKWAAERRNLILTGGKPS